MSRPFRLRVRVIPNARVTGFTGRHEDELVLRLHAPAVEGKANKAAVAYLAEFFDVPKSAVCLTSGEKGRHKIFEIIGLSVDAAERKLAAVSH